LTNAHEFSKKYGLFCCRYANKKTLNSGHQVLKIDTVAEIIILIKAILIDILYGFSTVKRFLKINF